MVSNYIQPSTYRKKRQILLTMLTHEADAWAGDILFPLAWFGRLFHTQKITLVAGNINIKIPVSNINTKNSLANINDASCLCMDPPVGDSKLGRVEYNKEKN